MKKNTFLLATLIFTILFYSCGNDDCLSPNGITPTNLEVEYGCVDTKYQMDIQLNDDYTIIRSQQSFDNLVTGSCTPQIDFAIYDLLIGKKGLPSGNASINYSFFKHPCDAQPYLQVEFIQNATTVAPNITYHALLPKLAPNETVNVELVIN